MSYVVVLEMRGELEIIGMVSREGTTNLDYIGL
jgi:hypothetical protein